MASIKTAVPPPDERDAAIKKFKRQLLARFKGADRNTKKTAEKLAERAAFMAVTLNELEQDIAENGAVMIATNGNGFDVKQENPAQRSYNTMIKNYNSTIMSLDKLARECGMSAAADPLLDFIAKHSK